MASEALVIEDYLLGLGRRPAFFLRLLVESFERTAVFELARGRLVEPFDSIRPFFSIWRAISSMCLSLMSTPWAR